MALDIIGPGFGRTGTASLKRALDTLSFGPCHHMEEVFANPPQADHWVKVVAKQPVTWDEVFAGYRSQVDWPGAHVWRELAAHYPKAKVVLSVRPEEAWWKSFSATIAKLVDERANFSLPPHVAVMLEAAGVEMIGRQTFGGRITDKATAIAAFRRRTEEVKAAIPSERLLVFDVAQGWEPLCRFLGVPVPAEPFPSVNSTEDFWPMVRGEKALG